MTMLAMAIPRPNPIAPQGPRRVETHKHIPAARVAPERATLLRLLMASGWTSAQAEAVRGINDDHLGALVENLPPDFDLYETWGKIGRLGRLNAAQFTSLMRAANQHSYTPSEVQALTAYGKGPGRRLSEQDWLVDHMSSGNRVPDILPWGKITPGWIVRWERTRETPTDVPEVALGEGHLWAYMELIMKFPTLPEAVIAHTLALSPDPRGCADTPGLWLRACWNPITSAAAA